MGAIAPINALCVSWRWPGSWLEPEESLALDEASSDDAIMDEAVACEPDGDSISCDEAVAVTSPEQRGSEEGIGSDSGVRIGDGTGEIFESEGASSPVELTPFAGVVADGDAAEGKFSSLSLSLSMTRFTLQLRDALVLTGMIQE